MVVVPVFVLAEGAAVTGHVAAAASFGGFATAVPARLSVTELVLLFGKNIFHIIMTYQLQ